MTSLVDDSAWYEQFLEECQAIIVESSFNSREELLKGKWELGRTITESEGLFQSHGFKYGRHTVERVAKDLNRSMSDIWRCVQFYKTYPNDTFSEVMERLPEGKSISWYKVITKYLPKETEQKLRNKLFMKVDVGINNSIDNEYFSFSNKTGEDVVVKIYVKRTD